MPPKELDLDVYSSIFDRHLQETQAHLQGAAFPEERTENQVVGSVLWTYDEINIFFHALAIHSRLRPDLISACIRTKNVLDVVEYLDLLDDNLKLVGRQSSNDGNRAPIAHEMSNSWVSWEENQARSLQTRENNSRKQASCRILQRSFENENVADSALDAEYSSSDAERVTKSRELSPISRRRYQKRVCMRRIRAKKSGEEVNTTISLLRPGRRRKIHKHLLPEKTNRKLSKNALPEAPDHEDMTIFVDELQADPLTSGRPRSPSHTDGSSEYTTKLIHVPNLRNFLRFHIGLYDKKLLDGTEDINSNVVDLLVDMTRDFVSDVVCRAAVLQEEHKAMKGSLKVWHQGYHKDGTMALKQSTIRQCLDSMGLGTQTRKQYFQDLLTSFDMQLDNDQNEAERQDDFTSPLPCNVLPRSFTTCTEPIDWHSAGDEDGEHSDEDRQLDKEDSVADWTYEVDIWNQVNQSVDTRAL